MVWYDPRTWFKKPEPKDSLIELKKKWEEKAKTQPPKEYKAGEATPLFYKTPSGEVRYTAPEKRGGGGVSGGGGRATSLTTPTSTPTTPTAPPTAPQVKMISAYKEPTGKTYGKSFAEKLRDIFKITEYRGEKYVQPLPWRGTSFGSPETTPIEYRPKVTYKERYEYEKMASPVAVDVPAEVGMGWIDERMLKKYQEQYAPAFAEIQKKVSSGEMSYEKGEEIWKQLEKQAYEKKHNCSKRISNYKTKSRIV